MKLRTYLFTLSPADREAMADRLLVAVGHLSRVARGHRTASQALAERIVEDTDGLVALKDLRPLDYGLPPIEPPHETRGAPRGWKDERDAAFAELAHAIRLREMRAATAKKRARSAKKKPARRAA